ncbi:MocR-like pyridoxine biosynthesis transcription factor PdxR [Pseudomonas costantinii]|uniref:GntR family transcriptional regulator n=1 Tax=Pseudomonas costantinii TaxID=168469 RepID=A0A1S2V0B5_9PSED|nr:PLP-dependent aminotransferase family protein [Pseudomonas costantinii]NVZ18361.1 PLP-dependent aminotransferase family protein [Pseudomonas costantinii]OIN52134.1 GntR family transcriptional regulator [Pseudomonas costantinii]SED36565.1 transcriptional regulator, GntR family [Pseudomonas costantinii]
MSRGKAASALDLPRPDTLDAGKQQGAYEALRGAILNRQLPAGSRLPSTRSLAERWLVSRGTLEAAFERLHSEGYVQRVAGSGTRVCAVIPEQFIAAPASSEALRRKAVADQPETGVQSHVPFVARRPDASLFDLKAWARCISRGLLSVGPGVLEAAHPAGLSALREQIADYLRSHRGMQCEADEVIVTTGIRHALDLIARTLLKPGDTACIEDPGYKPARRLFKLAGAQVQSIPVTAEGLDTAQLPSTARLAYVTPAHQAPLGMTLSVSRRLALLDWAARADAWVVEDDYDSEYNYNSAPLAALKSLDSGDRVIYCGSFNKNLFPGLRVGFMVVPKMLRPALLRTLQLTGHSVGATDQLGLVDFLGSGAFVRHLRASRQAYQARRDALLACLPDGCTVSGQQAGLHFVLWLPAGVEEGDFCTRAAAVGLTLQPLGTFCVDASLPPAVIIGYTALTLAQIRYHGRALAQLLMAA